VGKSRAHTTDRSGEKLSHVYNAAYLAALDDLISRLARHHMEGQPHGPPDYTVDGL